MKIDYCKKCDCGSKRPIVNKTHGLCSIKNRERLKNQKTYKHIQKTKGVNKGTLNKEKLNVLYKEIEQERDCLCEGCKNSNSITHSHTIPRSRRKDLELDKKNIVYLCMNCHNVWEHGILKDKNKLLNFDNMMQYIKDNDNEYYNLLISKWIN